jgi:DNA-binding response OmpR family regulator
MPEWRVLVVDDDTHMLDLMTRRLARMGMQADRAQDGRTAVSLVLKTAYDLILTDIYMPEGTGLDILRAAKENDPHVQVIVVTGSATLDNAVEALNMGAFSYLSKPFDHMSVFDNAVSRALEFRRLIRDNQRMAEIQRRRGDMLEAEVTDRIRQMRRRQQDMIDLLARLPEGVLVVDSEGRILLSNAPAEEWLAREARLEVQPLRRYLSSLTPPRRPTQTETEIDGAYLRLTAQALPPEEGKPRILVTIGDAGDEGADVRRQLHESLAQLKPGLDWLARQALDRKETEVVRVLLTQIGAIETMLGGRPAPGRGLPVPEVDWQQLGLDGRREDEPVRGRPTPAGEGRAAPAPAAPQWPPPRASDEMAQATPAPKRAARPSRGRQEEKKVETVILGEEGERSLPLEETSSADVPAPSSGLEEGLERLLQHLAETPVPEEVAFPEIEAEEEAPEGVVPPDVRVPDEPEAPAPPPHRTSGLLSKIRRDPKGKEVSGEAPSPPLERVFRPVGESAPPTPTPTARPPGSRGEGRAPAKPIPLPPPTPTPPPTPPPTPHPERAAGLLGKMRRAGKPGGPPPSPAPGPEKARAAEPPPPGKSLRRPEPAPEERAPAEKPHRAPVPAPPEPPEKDLSELLNAVREAAETGRLREQAAAEAGPPQAPPAPQEPPAKPPPGKRAPVWPPPLPSESDEE